MPTISRRSASSLTIIVSIAVLCWFALGCGLFAGDQPAATPKSEQDIGATVEAAVRSVEATRQAAAPTAVPEPESTPTMAPTEAARTEGAGDLPFAFSELGPDARWGDLFAAFSDAEQSCIRSELSEERFAMASEKPFFHEDNTQEWEVAIFGCLAQETAAALFHALLTAQMGPEVGLTEENEACIQGLLADADFKSLVAGSSTDATAEQAEALFGFFFGLEACVPETASTGPGRVGQQDETRLWSFATGGWASAAPTVADSVVYAGADDHRVYALDAATGGELWNFATNDAVKSAPTVADGVVYVGSNDNHLYALDAVSGAMIWSHDTGAWVQYSPTVSDGRVYAGTLVNGEPRVAALDASSGTLLWTAQEPLAFDAEFAPAVAGNLVYVPGAEHSVFHALYAATGEVTWTASVGSYVESAPTVLDGVVYLTVVNEAYALDEMTGEVIWSYDTEQYPARDFPALVVDGVYYLSPDRFLHALDVATGEPLWTYQAAGLISAAPAVYDGAVFAATETGQVFAVDAATGAELWTLAAEGSGLQALTVADGVLYVESDLGILMAVDTSNGQPVGKYQKAYFLGLRNYTVHDGVLYFGAFPNGVYAHAVPEP